MKRLWPILVALIVVFVAACGGSSHTRTLTHTSTTTTTATATVTHTTTAPPSAGVPDLRCSPTDQTMNCVLANQPPPATLKATPGSTYGIDFGWSAVSARAAKRLGAHFAFSYLSNDATKNWTRALVDSYHHEGLATVAGWESTANRAEQGPIAGAEDAQAAASQAAAAGEPTNRPIIFAVDCDCTVASIKGYFQGVHRVLPNRAQAYGGYDQVLGLYQAHLVGHENFQTYAWSNGRWLPASIAPLEQYLNGNVYDNDRAIAPLYGQWPAKATPTKPKVSLHYNWMPNVRRRFKIKAYSPVWGAPRVVHTRERSAIRWLDGHGCNPKPKTNRFVRPGCVEHAEHARLLKRRISDLAHHTPNHKHKVAKPRWGAPHYKVKGHTTTLGGANRQLGRRLVHHRKPIRQW